MHTNPQSSGPVKSHTFSYRWDFISSESGKDSGSYETEDGFTVRFTDEKFKQCRHSEKELKSLDIEGRVSDLEQKIEQISSILRNKEPIPPNIDLSQNAEEKPHESTTLIPAG